MRIPLICLCIACCCSSALAADAYFPQGTRAFELSGSYVSHIRFSDDFFYSADVAVGYYLFDNFSVSADLQASYVDQPFDDAKIGAGGFLLRWHALHFDRFTLFADAGGMISYADPQVPDFGTHFNFIAKVGPGVSMQLNDSTHLMIGSRYFHLSNGNIHGRDQNPSYDGVQFWAGLLWTW